MRYIIIHRKADSIEAIWNSWNEARLTADQATRLCETLTDILGDEWEFGIMRVPA